MTRNIQQTIEKLSITHLHLTPAMASRIRPQDVRSVQYLFTSSEELTAKVHRDWAGRGLCQGKLGYRSCPKPLFPLVRI